MSAQTSILSNINTKQALRYTLAPQIVSRFRDVFGSGFYYAAYFIALVYSAVKLLPDNHPYVRTSNIGKYGVRHVIAEAADNVKVDRDNIDKLVLFGLVLLGLGIVVTQIILILGGLFIQSALAQDGWAQSFITQDAANDLAFMFMDLVFGVPGVFKSCVTQTTMDSTPCVGIAGEQVNVLLNLTESGFPFPIHHALHQMLSLYSTGLMLIGVLITSYFVFTVLAETAQTGTPFGKRFNKVWAPLRLVVAFALLMPIGNGLNSAQYIVLYAAKFGSGFATNGWIKFNETLGQETLSRGNTLVSVPQTPQVTGYLRFLFAAKTCAFLYEESYPDSPEQVMPYLVPKDGSRDPLEITYDAVSGGTPYYVENDSEQSPSSLYGYAGGANSADIVFGIRALERDNAGNPVTDNGKAVYKYPDYPGAVRPVCGKLKFKFSDVRKPFPINTENLPDNPSSYAEIGIDALQRYHWHTLKLVYFTDMFFGYIDETGSFKNAAEKVTQRFGLKKDDDVAWPPTSDGADSFPQPAYRMLTQDYKYVLSVDCNGGNRADGGNDEWASCSYIEDEYRAPGFLHQKNVVLLQKESSRWHITPELRAKGWAAAGIWYNKIAELNGALNEAVLNIPEPMRFPEVMERTAIEKFKYNQSVDPAEKFKPDTLSNGKDISYAGLNIQNASSHAKTLWEGYSIWDSASDTPHTQSSGNAFVDGVKALFGLEGLYNLRKNRDVHPLAQVVGIGKSLIETSVRNIGYALTGRASSLILRHLDMTQVGNAVDITVGFLTSVTMVAVSMGFILYYVVPFLPFVYFFFAVAGWVKGIFEALVGAPLWALGHIRIDGNGLPGSGAETGYFLIFEIFLRPILVVFGLLASISIFAALVGVLGDLWGMVIDNVGGFDVRSGLEGLELTDEGATRANVLENMGSAIDQFFYTVVYAILVYMIGMSSFKLIDLIPNQILRWMGSGATGFNDNNENPVEGLIGSTYSNVNQLTGHMQKLVGGK